MKHLKLFVALFAMLALGVTNAWGYEVELSTFSATSAEMDNYISYTTAKGGGTSDPAINSNQIRLYQGNPGGNITISAKEGATITEVTIGSAMKTTIKWEIDETVDTDGTSLAANATATKSGISTTSITCHCYGADSKNRLYVNYLKVVYTVEGGAVTIVKTLKSIDVEGMTTDYETDDIFRFDGTCTATYSVTKNDVAQEDEQKVVTPTSVSTPDMSTAGKKEVTVTYTEDEVAVTATYIINVTENVITAGEYALALNNTFFGCGTGNNEIEQVKKSNDILVTAGCLSSASSKTYYDASHVRFYKDSYLKFSVPAGYVITSITFAEPSSSKKWDGSITVDAGVDAGTYTDNTKSWAGSAQEVVFSFGAQNRIATATVTYAEAGETPEPVMFTVTATAENGTVEGAGEYEEGTEVTLTATPADGYKFTCWTSGVDTVSTANPFTFTVTSDTTLVANFQEVEPVKLYLNAKDWGYGDARFAAYFFDPAKWVDMTKVEGETYIYEVEVPAGYTKVIFVRMNGSTTENNWDNKWNQTGNLDIPTDGKNMFKPDDWEGKTTTWSTYTPSVKYTFTKGSTWYIDFSAITGKKGANYPKADVADIDYSANAGGTVIPVTFTADVTWAEGATFIRTEEGGWDALTFTTPTEGANCAQVAADGKSYTWTTYVPVVEPEVIAYELNGGELPAVVVPTQDSLIAAFKDGYNAYFGVSVATTRDIANFLYAGATVNDPKCDVSLFMTDDASPWKWLGDYVLAVTNAQIEAGLLETLKELATELMWRQSLTGFFLQQAKLDSNYKGNADFTEAGKPEVWSTAYEAAHAVVLPTEPVDAPYTLPTPVKDGFTFVGWYDNAEGTGEAYTVIPAGWSGTLYAIWKQGTATALENIAVEGKAVKAIINGQLIIIKNGVQYNAQGQVIK